MLKLREIGLLEPDGRRGGRIVRPSRSAIRQAYELREALEVFAARVAAERATEPQRRDISKAAQRFLEAALNENGAGCREWDAAFHRAIAVTVGNPRLEGMIDDAFALVMTLRQRDMAQAEFSMRCAKAHLRIAETIAQGTPDEAEAALRAHVRAVEGYVLSCLADESVA